MRLIFGVLLIVGVFFTGNVCAQNTQETVITETKVAKETSSATTSDEKSTVEEFNIDELKEKAADGDVEAQLNLGYAYLYGLNGVNIDYKQALTYYQMAADQKNATAYNNLGSLYFSGVGTDVDYKKAIQFFEEAANLGSHDAAVNLAIIYLGSDYKNKKQEDFDKILKLLNEAEEDSYIAKYLLGYAHLRGFLVKQDNKKAFSLIKVAADNEYDEAQYALAQLYLRGIGTPKNYSKTVEYLRKAGNQGYMLALTKLGDILSRGKIYPKDTYKAHILYNIASVMGDKEAPAKRDQLEKDLKIEDLLVIQAAAENYIPSPSQNTQFIRQTFGDSLRSYVDSNIPNGEDPFATETDAEKADEEEE